MQSADHVDLLCAFIKWYGLRLVEEPIRDLIARGGRLRVITTTYMGATDQRALERLAELGAEIRVSYETRTTRLHAKAWLFRRSTGAGTAYVGSSNLSRAAMVDGVEWNVRLAQLEQPTLLDTFAATFDEYWADASFEEYEPQRDADRLRTALALESGPRPTDLSIDDRLDRLTGVPRSGDRLEAMIRRLLWGGESDADVDSHPQLRREVDDVAAVLRRRIRRVTEPLDPTGRNPLRVHARYSRDEACLAFGFTDFANFREGVKWLPDEQADIFFVTLTKTDRP
jgi:HKD family nuclease